MNPRQDKESHDTNVNHCNYYLNKPYCSPCVFEAIQPTYHYIDVLLVEGIQIGIKCLTNDKTKEIESYQAYILELGSLIMVLHIKHIFNATVKQGFLKTWIEILIVLIFKFRNQDDPTI